MAVTTSTGVILGSSVIYLVSRMPESGKRGPEMKHQREENGDEISRNKVNFSPMD